MGGFGFWSMSCYAVLSVQSSLSIISLRRESWLLYFNRLLADFWLLVFCAFFFSYSAVSLSAMSECGIF